MGQQQRLGSSQTPFVNPAPQIIFGSLALQSIYFAADFTDRSVGLANKLSANAIASFAASSSGCATTRRGTCKGSQHFQARYNRCINPNCQAYFLTELDHDTMTCQFRSSSMIVGLVFVCLFATAEIISYFVVQYSATSLVDARRHQHRSDIGVGVITKEVGRVISIGVDWFIIHVYPGNMPAPRGAVQLNLPV